MLKTDYTHFWEFEDAAGALLDSVGALHLSDVANVTYQVAGRAGFAAAIFQAGHMATAGNFAPDIPAGPWCIDGFYKRQAVTQGWGEKILSLTPTGGGGGSSFDLYAMPGEGYDWELTVNNATYWRPHVGIFPNAYTYFCIENDPDNNRIRVHVGTNVYTLGGVSWPNWTPGATGTRLAIGEIGQANGPNGPLDSLGFIPRLLSDDEREFRRTNLVPYADWPADLGVVPAPQFSPAPGSYAAAQAVTLTCGREGAVIRYTLDGSLPTETHGTVYAAPFTLEADATVRAIAYKPGFVTSGVSVAPYTFTIVRPVTFTPAAGAYGTAQTVALASTTPLAQIRYTLDGSTPSVNAGTLYTGPIVLGGNAQIGAIAYRDGWVTAAVTQALFYLKGGYLATTSVGVAGLAEDLEIEIWRGPVKAFGPVRDGIFPTGPGGTDYARYLYDFPALQQQDLIYWTRISNVDRSLPEVFAGYLYGDSGAADFTYTLFKPDGVTPLPGATVWVSSDALGVQRSQSKTTDALGRVTFQLSPGPVYVWRQHNGFTFNNPDAEAVPDA